MADSLVLATAIDLSTGFLTGDPDSKDLPEATLIERGTPRDSQLSALKFSDLRPSNQRSEHCSLSFIGLWP
jgi:hypothetical protein